MFVEYVTNCKRHCWPLNDRVNHCCAQKDNSTYQKFE